MLFTDGEETANTSPDDFFNPLVQAKRLQLGLGCAADADCTGGARCEEGVCRPPAGTVVADVVDLIDLVEGGGAERLVDGDGRPLSITVHVVDASEGSPDNALIAAYGGGQYMPVDLADPAALVQTFETLLDDIKQASPCAAE